MGKAEYWTYLSMFIIYMEILHTELISILTHENFEAFVTGDMLCKPLINSETPL